MQSIRTQPASGCGKDYIRRIRICENLVIRYSQKVEKGGIHLKAINF